MAWANRSATAISGASAEYLSAAS